MGQQDPTGPNEATLQGNPVSNIPADRAEGMLSLLKLTPNEQPSSMGDLINQHHQTRLANAQMYSNSAKSALHAQLMIQHGIDPETGARFDDPTYKGPSAEDQAAKYQANYNEAWTNYKKLAGVDQNTKGALAKAEQILNHILGGGAMQSAPGAPSNQGRQGGMPPPPTPQYGSSVTEKGVIPTPAAGTNVGEAGVALTPPPTVQPGPEANPLAAPMVEANTQFQQGQQRATAEQQRKFKTDIEQRTKEADILDLPEGSRERRQYIATGNFPAVFGLQSKPIEFTDENGKIQRVIANYDKTNGTYEYNGKIITNPRIADKPQLIKYMKPDVEGKPHLVGGFMLGTELFDQQMNPLPANTEFYSRGLQGRDTLHQSITMGPDGKPIITTLESISNPTFTKAIWGDEPSSGATLPSNTPVTTPGGVPTGGAGTAAPAAPQRKGGLPSAPKPQVSGGGGGATRAAKTTDAAGRPLGIPTGIFKTQAQGATGVDQARNSLVGDNIEKGQVSGLAKDLDVFKDPAATARIGEYLQLVHNLTAVEGDSLAKSDDTIGAVKWFAGMPQAVIGLQQGALRDKYNQLTTADKKFVADYFRVMGTMGGMRASTGMPGYQWAFTNMYNEMPTPGKVNDYDDAVRRLMNYVNETNVVTKRNPLVPKLDVEDVEKKIRGGSNKLTPPPTPSSSTNRPPLSSFEH